MAHGEFGVSLTETAVGRALKKLGYVKLMARPRHQSQNKYAIGVKKGAFVAELAKIKAALPRATPIEVWFQNEARIGQKNKITRRYAKRGTRPSAPTDPRTKSVYIFGAIRPELGKGARLIVRFCNTQTMSLHLLEISLAIEPGAHGMLLMDQAGWHMTIGRHK